MGNTTRKSPGITSTEISSNLPASANFSSVLALPVQSEKGVVGKAQLVTNSDEYIRLFGSGRTERQRADRATVQALLETGLPVVAVRYIDTASAVYASTTQEDPNQVTSYRIEGSNVIVENTQQEFKVIAIYASGDEVDVTDSPDITYRLTNLNLGRVEAGVFFASGILGEGEIVITVSGDTVIYPIEVAQLRVDRLQVIGPSELEYARAEQYRVIAYFLDGTAKDVTFDPETQWDLVSGNITTFVNGKIGGETTSVPTQAEFSIQYRNLTETHTVTLKPTTFQLFLAGRDVFKLGNFTLDLDPEFTGNVRSHTVEWEITQGVNGNITDVNSLSDAQFTLLPGADTFYEITLYIDRGTAAEQSDSFLVSRSAVSTASTEPFVMRSFLESMEAEGRLTQSGSLTQAPDYLIGPIDAVATIGTVPTVEITSIYDEANARYDLFWTYTYDENLLKIETIEVQVKLLNGRWSTIETLTDVNASSSVPRGFYRLRTTYTQSSANKRFQFPTGSQVTTSDPVELVNADLRSEYLSTHTTSMRLESTAADVSNLTTSIFSRKAESVTSENPAHYLVGSSAGDVSNMTSVIPSKTTYRPETIRSMNMRVALNPLDVSNLNVIVLTSSN